MTAVCLNIHTTKWDGTNFPAINMNGMVHVNTLVYLICKTLQSSVLLTFINLKNYLRLTILILMSCTSMAHNKKENKITQIITKKFQ